MSDYSDFNNQGSNAFSDNPFGEAPFTEMPFEPVPFEENTPVQAAVTQSVQTTTTQQVSTVQAEPAATAVVAAAAADTTAGEVKDTAQAEADAAAAEEAQRKAEHEAAEAQRKAEYEARKAEKKKNEQLQLLKMQNLSDADVMAAAAQRASEDTEKITRRSLKECVSEYIQTLCFSDPAFARLTMHPRKNMINCFMYIQRKAQEYVQDEIKLSGIKPGPGMQIYSTDIPDDLCYKWAEDYFRDPTVQEDEEKEEKFVPRPYISKNGSKTTVKKSAEKKKPAEKKPAEKKPPEPQKPADDGQISFGQMAMAI